MEKVSKKWSFRGNKCLNISADVTVRGSLSMLMENINREDQRPAIMFSHGDPAAFPCFRTSHIAEKAVVDTLQSAKFNCYAPFVGILPARKAVAEYLSQDLPYEISPDDVNITVGCGQAMKLAAHLAISKFFIMIFFLEKGWEVDLDAVEALADENTVAMVTQTARKLGILVIADEVYEHLTFGSNPFVPLAAFASTVPVITLGSISKKWAVPGWKLGWLVMCDPSSTLQKSGIAEHIKACLNITSDPVTFIQGALTQILKKTGGDFFLKYIKLLRHTSNVFYDRIMEIPCITCPHKPEGSVFVMVKLDLSLLEGIDDDWDFCFKLAKEESVIVLPGVAVGLKNWLRISFALELSTLEDGLGRIKSFCQTHCKQQ